MQLVRAFVDDEAIEGPDEPDVGDEEPAGIDIENEGGDNDGNINGNDNDDGPSSGPLISR